MSIEFFLLPYHTFICYYCDKRQSNFLFYIAFSQNLYQVSFSQFTLYVHRKVEIDVQKVLNEFFSVPLHLRVNILANIKNGLMLFNFFINNVTVLVDS